MRGKAPTLFSSHPVWSSLVSVALLAGTTTAPVAAHEGGSPYRYVVSGGVDKGDCHDPDRPCRTILYAISKAAKGDRVLVAGGTYQFDPAEIPLLLSEMVQVSGGYSPADRFAARAAGANPTYVIGPSPEFREELAERGLTLVQDRKGLGIEQTIQERARVTDQEGAPARMAPQGVTPCADGRAGAYPCDGVDFLARIPLEGFSSNPSAANDVWGFVDLNDQREYAIIGLRNGTAVVDVTDPSNPVEVGTIQGLESIWRDIKVYQFRDQGEGRWKAYAYVTTDAAPQGLHIIDLTGLPERISLAATYRGFASAHNIYISNVDYATGVALPDMTPYAYVLGSNLDLGAFRILALSDPVAPVEVTSPPSGTEYVHDVTSVIITDARASACHPGHNPCEVMVDYNENTVDLWDVTDKANPLMLSSMPYENSAYTHSGWWSRDKKFVFIQDELDEQDIGLNTTVRTVDISDLTRPFVSNVWTGPTRAIDHNGFAKGDRYYISNYRRGLTILDIADPNEPREAAFFDTFPDPADDGPFFNGAWGTYPYLPSGTILVSDIEGGLFLLREQRPTPRMPLLAAPVAAEFGYAWADDATADRYAPSTTYSHNLSGGPIEITRSGTGTYAVRFAGLGGAGTAGGHVQVTAYGPESETCKVERWNSSGADFVADVRCFDTAGKPADARYTVLVIGPEPGELPKVAVPSEGAAGSRDRP
jgi:choice-of-anchor B domain-containing protein